MVTREELQGRWNQVKGQIRERWGDITDDELQKVHGNTEKLVGLIQEKTGSTKREIESFIETSVREGAGVLNQVAETAKEYTNRAATAVSDQYQAIGEKVEANYEEAQEMVRNRPVESIGVAFGVGLIAGAVLSLVFRSSRA